MQILKEINTLVFPSRKTSKSDVGMETQQLSARAVIIGPKTYHYE